MTTSTNISVVGVKDAIRSLNKLEPGLRKQFAAEAQSTAEPVFAEARRRYNFAGWGQTRLRNVSYKWAGPATGGRQVFPFNTAKASKGLKLRLEGDRRTTATIVLQQMDAGTAIMESAGRKTQNALGQNLGPLKPNHTRVLGPSLFAKRDEVNKELEKQIFAILKRINEELR